MALYKSIKVARAGPAVPRSDKPIKQFTLSTMSLRSHSIQHPNFHVSFPHERVVQVTLNRPQKLNSLDLATSREIQKVWELFDQDESLWVGIITGTGRAFCTGADLQGIFDFYALKDLCAMAYLLTSRVA